MATDQNTERIFYDGDCGVCHWSVTFVAKRDPSGETFRFAPLEGPTFQEVVGHGRELPDSILVQTASGELLDRSDGVIYILRRLGPKWRFLGRLISFVPRPLRDLGYDLFARIRHRLAARPEEACPAVPLELGRRFDA